MQLYQFVLGAASPRVEKITVLPPTAPRRFPIPSSSTSSMRRSREEDIVVDIRVSWPSAASLDFRLQTDNSPKMKLRLDRFAMMLMLIDD